jgi:murein DD-endopeptidase MepM/ murein hydrolase activator NlpD
VVAVGVDPGVVDLMGLFSSWLSSLDAAATTSDELAALRDRAVIDEYTIGRLRVQREELREKWLAAERRATAAHLATAGERARHAETLRRAETAEGERDVLRLIVADGLAVEVYPDGPEAADVDAALVAALASTEAHRDRLAIEAEGFRAERLSYARRIQVLEAKVYDLGGSDVECTPSADVADIGRSSTRYEPVDGRPFGADAGRVLR